MVQILLLVVPLQLHQLQQMLVKKFLEYFDVDMGCDSSLEEDVPRLFLNHFQWLDFPVNSNDFTDELLIVVLICPLQLKK